MVLVIGGSESGAKEFATRYYIENLQDDGDLILNYQDEIRSNLSDAASRANELLEAGNAAVIHMQEVGCGVIPADKTDILYREESGRISCLFAKQADAVYRVICGIAQKIK